MTSSTERISASATSLAVRYTLMELELELELEVIAYSHFLECFLFLPVYLSNVVVITSR